MREHAKSVSWRDGSSQQARAEVAVAYVFFPYVLMYVVRNPSVPDWDRDGNLTLPYLTVEYGFWVVSGLCGLSKNCVQGVCSYLPW